MQRVIVTGATGNLGTRVVQSLRSSEQVGEIVAVARHLPPVPLEGTTFVQADVSKDDLVSVFKGADAVIHLAWLLQPSHDEQMLERVNVIGSRRVFDAVVCTKVPKIIVASSVGSYSMSPKDRLVDESWPTGGISTSLYSQQKVAVERQMDVLEQDHPNLIVTRVRTSLVFQRLAGSEIKRLFLGSLVPRAMFRPSMIPFVPDLEQLRFQIVNAEDVGQAFRLAVERNVCGAFNLAADPVLDPNTLSEALDARRIRISAKTLRRFMAASYRLRLHPSDPSWLDLAFQLPLMSTDRARRELGWSPQHSSTATLLELLEGIRTGAGASTWPLRSRSYRSSPLDERPPGSRSHAPE